MTVMTIIPDVEKTGMTTLRKFDGAPMEKLLEDGNVIHLTTPLEVGALRGGMQSGRASVMLSFDLPDGRVVIAETSLAMFTAAARALEARYGGD